MVAYINITDVWYMSPSLIITVYEYVGFLCGLFYDAISVASCIELNGRMAGE
jgi:hypothetical protein